MQQFQPVDQIQPPPLDPPPSDPSSPQVLDYGTLAPPRASRPERPARERLWPAMGWWRHIMACMGFMTIVLLAFNNSYKSGMTLDNKYIIEEYYKSIMKGQRDMDLQSWQEVGLLFANDYWWPKGISGLYRPITTLTYWFDYVIFTKRDFKRDAQGEIIRDPLGQPVVMSWYEYATTPGRKLDTTSYHTVNLIVHWLNGVLLYFVSLMLIKRFWPAFLVGALFLAHPITTESVTNIIGRADMFAGVAVFGGLLLYVRGMRNSDSWALPWLFGLMTLTAFGVFSKESSAAVVLVAICYDLVHHWRSGEEGKNGLAVLIGRSLAYGMVMILIPLMAGSWSEIVLHPARFPMIVRIGLTVLILGYGAGQYVLLAHLRPEPREPLMFLGGVLVSTIFASILLPFYSLILPIGVGLVELARLWMKLLREDRFGELPRLIGHGILYLGTAGALIGLPVMCGLFLHQLGGPNLSSFLRGCMATGLLVGGLAIYIVMARSGRIARAISLAAFAACLFLATLSLPFVSVRWSDVPLIEPITTLLFGRYISSVAGQFTFFIPLLLVPVGTAVAVIELSRGTLTSTSDRFRVMGHATLYFFLFLALIALPIGALIAFHRLALDEWFPVGREYLLHLNTYIPQWQWYAMGATAFAAGLFLHIATIGRDRTTRAGALCVILLAIIVASFCSYFMGIVLGVIVAIHEVILGSLLPNGEQYRRDWKRIWHGFALGYLVMVPPLLAMWLVRMWVFSNATPAEEPFLDNPIRGIWKVQELGMKSFEEELAKKPLEGMSFPECKMTAVKVLGKCVYLVAWPWTLCSDYSYDEFPNFSWYLYRWEDWKAVLSLFFFIGCGYAAYQLRDRNRAACFFIICFFAAALPTSNLTITIGSVMAERFMYLPLGAFAGVVVIAVFRLGRLLYDSLRDGDESWVTFHYSLWAAAALCVILLSTHNWDVHWFIIWAVRLSSAAVLLLLYALLPLKKLWHQKTTWAFIQHGVWSFFGLLAVCVASYRWGTNLFIVFGCIFSAFAMIVLVLLYLITALPDGESSDDRTAALWKMPWTLATPIVALSSLMIVYGVRAYDRNFVWEDDLHLWTDAIKTSTRSFRCYQSLAFAKYEQNPKKNIDEMIDIDERGVPIVDHLPNHLNSSRLYLHLGMFYVLKGEFLSTQTAEGPIPNNQSTVWYDKARAILEKGAQVDRAFNELNYTKQLLRGDKPETICNAGLGPVYTTMAVAYSKLGRPDIAANRLLYARQLDPTDPEVYEKFSYVMAQMQRYEDAGMAMIQSIVLNPSENPNAWKYLPVITQKLGPEWADAVSIQGAIVKMNIQNPMLQQLIVRSFRDLMSGFLRSRRPAMAMQVRDLALSRYEWISAEALDSVFDDPVPDVSPEGILRDRTIPGPGRPGNKKQPTTKP